MNIIEYWETVESNWDNLLNLVEKFHPNTVRVADREDIIGKYPITAKKAEIVCEEIRHETERKNPLRDFVRAKEEKNLETLMLILSETWFGMPESLAIHNEPGFYVLCDLCECPDGYEFDEENNLIKEQ